MNKQLLLVLGLAIIPSAAAAPEDPPDASQEPAALNVNARYLIDSVKITGWRKTGQIAKHPPLSNSLRADVDSLVGQNLDRPRLDELAKRLKKELHAAQVEVKVDKGESPEHVAVNFEVQIDRDKAFDLDVVRFVYHSRQGFSGEGNAVIKAHGNSFLFGLVSDNDQLAERFAGIRAGFERRNLGTERLRLRFLFSSFHDQWNGASRLAADPGELYRDRTSFAPQATVVLAQPLELSFGADFTRFRPDLPGARAESSNAVVSTLRYHQRWNSGGGEDQDLQAAYFLRSGTGVLESDRVFSRHEVDANYRLREGHSRLDIRFLAGQIGGVAPVFERFVLGNSRLLRGWNKFDLTPLGASHVIHGSIEYSYRGLLLFYDTGAIWNKPAEREQKNSLGIGFRSKDGFQLAVAFPVRNGAVDPVFYIGAGF
jgi:hypothetical protein